ncbi:MAG: SusE domain-containing protein [Chloroherpetonaceae bacterium]|nr:SusE domain-containing protein [Chloroherpetonaceae bacterium]MCS7210395.1 SusE domain-containing protein [Chloroherpetonaceae bacterium]MDW8019204.1 SusE domain-containing protein [Chloroherpetonaceae bacterium]
MKKYLALSLLTVLAVVQSCGPESNPSAPQVPRRTIGAFRLLVPAKDSLVVMSQRDTLRLVWESARFELGGVIKYTAVLDLDTNFDNGRVLSVETTAESLLVSGDFLRALPSFQNNSPYFYTVFASNFRDTLRSVDRNQFFLRIE